MATLTKQQLIELITKRYGENDYFDLEIEIEPPERDDSLMGCKFGSAEHMLKRPPFRKERESLKLRVTMLVENR